MIQVLQGSQNIWLLPKIEILDSLGGAFILTAINDTTKEIRTCMLVDDQSMIDYRRFPFTEIAAGADPLQSQISLREIGNWTFHLSEALVYTTDPNIQIELRQERAFIKPLS